MKNTCQQVESVRTDFPDGKRKHGGVLFTDIAGLNIKGHFKLLVIMEQLTTSAIFLNTASNCIKTTTIFFSSDYNSLNNITKHSNCHAGLC